MKVASVPGTVVERIDPTKKHGAIFSALEVWSEEEDEDRNRRREGGSGGKGLVAPQKSKSQQDRDDEDDCVEPDEVDQRAITPARAKRTEDLPADPDRKHPEPLNESDDDRGGDGVVGLGRRA